MNVRRPTYSEVMCTMLVLITFAVSLGWLLPLSWFTDDYNFLQAIMGGGSVYEDFHRLAFEKAGAVPHLGEIATSCANHWLYVSSRLSNVFVIIFTHSLSHSTIEVIVSACIALTVTLLSPRRSPLAYSATIALMWCLLPWHDLMQSVAFQFNYPIAGFLWLIALRYYANRTESISLTALLLFFLLGMWHEGFTIVLLTFMVLRWPIRHDRPRLLFTLSAALGLLVCVVGGTLGRVSHVGISGMSLRETVHALLPFAIWLAIAGLIIATSHHKPSRRLVTALLVAVAVDLILTVATSAFGRMLWPAYLLTIATVLRSCEGIHVPRRRLAVGTFTALYIFWGLNLHATASAVGANEHAVARLMHAEVADERMQPWWLKGMVKSEFNSLRLYNVHQDMVVSATGGTDSAVLVLPPGVNELKGLKLMPGTANLHANGPLLYADSAFNYRQLRVTLGWHLPAASPYERISSLRYPSPLIIEVESARAPVHIDGCHDATLVFVDLMKPPLENREILRVDTID